MNIKISGIAAGIAFVFSLLIGLVSGAGIFALIRAFVFAVIFFAMSGGAYWLIYQFLPELFETPENSDAVPPAGSAVDISLEEEPEALLQGLEPEENEAETEAEHSEPSLQEDLSGLDQTDDSGYTNEGATNESPAHSAPESEAAEPADDPGPVDELPDLDSLSAAFSPGGGKKGGGELSEFTISSDSSIGGKSARSNKAGSLADDFSTHDMASAIQTIL
jgi:hypothetical protein